MVLSVAVKATNQFDDTRRTLPACLEGSETPFSISVAIFVLFIMSCSCCLCQGALWPEMPAVSAQRWIIAGGGAGGLTLAVLLRRLGREVVVLERRTTAEAPERDGHVGLGIWVNALRCLSQAGIKLPEGRYMRDSAYLAVDGRTLAKPGTMLQDGHLLFLRKHEFMTALKKALPVGVVRYGCGVKAVDEVGGREGLGVKVSLDGGDLVEGDVLVVADGIFSSVRPHTPSMKALQPCYRGYTVYRGVVNRTVQADLSFQTWGLGSRFASVPIKDGQVWFGTVVRPPGFTHAEGDDTQAFLLDRFRGWHSPIETLLKETAPKDIIYDDAFALPSSAFQQRFSSSCVTAIGDAAHGVDPILAQGTGVAIEDAYELATQVAAASSGDLATAFRAYEERTANRAKILSLLSDLSQGLGQMTSQTAIDLRDRLFTLSPSLLKGPIFDAMIRLSLAREWSGAMGSSYGYACQPLPPHKDE